MTNVALGVLSSCVVLAIASMSGAAPQQGRPGEIARPEVWVQNRTPEEALPVRMVDADPPMRVQVSNVAHVEVDRTVATAATRQAWEYSQVAIPSGQNAAAILNRMGVDGWETTGLDVPGANGAVIVVLKRPR